MRAVLAGVDGCRAGWVAALEEGGRTELIRLRTLADLPSCTALIDIPIGLPAAGPRRCDLEARRLLGRPRASSVFPAPPRSLLAAATPRCSRQLFNILPKIREADELAPQACGWFEGHPEVSFALMDGGRGLPEPKRTPAGRTRRRKLLGAAFADLPSDLDDDEADAYVLLWSARRLAAGCARRLPAEIELDGRGLLMQILA
jgi:predicted RNase H-like nuclease